MRVEPYIIARHYIYHDLGPDHFQRTSPETHAKRLARQIAKLGFTCTIALASAGTEVSI